MTAQEFQQIALDKISDQPFDRVPDEMQTIIKDPINNSVDQLFFDVHAHCFTYSNVPSGFPGMGIHPPEFVLKVLAKTINALGFIFSIARWKEQTYWNYYSKKRLLERMAKEPTADAILMHQFHRFNMGFEEKKRPRPHIIMTHLMMDMERGIKGKVEQGFYDQLLELSHLRKLRKHNKVILPFFAADPRNPTLFEDFLAVFTPQEKRVNKTPIPELATIFPFFGVKIYPCLGYFPSDPRLMTIFEVCEAKKIPITSHCGGASTRYNKSKWVEGKRLIQDATSGWKQEEYKIKAKPKGNKNRKIAQIFNAPNNWKPVAEAYPKLKINLAHFGSDYEWENYRNGEKNTHVDQTLELIAQYDQVYADISYCCAFDRNLKKIQGWFKDGAFPKEKQELWLRKILFGTDYYLTDRKKSLITIIKSIFEELDNELIQQFCLHNPKTFLFS